MAETAIDLDDARIIRRVRDGDTAAFALLVERHQRRVSGIVSGHAPPDRVRELCHETFVRTFRSLGGFKGQSPFVHWLSTIAVRACHDFWRKRYRERETVLSDLSEEGRRFAESVADERIAPIEEAIGRDEAALVLRAALDRLSPTDRMVLTLVHLEERSVAETAELLGLSAANVKVRAFRARVKMRAFLAETIGEA